MPTLLLDKFKIDSSNFLKWLGNLQGANVSPKIQIADMRCRKAGRGIVALEDIQEGEELFSIHHSDLLTIKNSDLPRRIIEDFKELDPWMSLILVMIYEASLKEKSKWWPYLQILPTQLDTLMYWSPVELAELRGCLVVEKIGKDDANQSFIKVLLPIIKNHAGLFEAFATAFASAGAEEVLLEIAHRMGSLIMAYAFDLEKDEDSMEDGDDDLSTSYSVPKGMIPLADMFNADGEMVNAQLLHQETSMAMIASKAIQKGKEIFNDYGQRPRSDLLRRYGYITDNSKKWDVVELDRNMVLQIASQHHNLKDSERNQRLQLIEDWDILEDGYDLHRQASEVFEFDRPLVLVIYVYTMEQDAFKLAKKARQAPEELPLNLAIASSLKQIIVQRFKDYNTSIIEDAIVLQDPTLQTRLRMAVEVRLGEKEILEAALAYLEMRIQELHPLVKIVSPSLPNIKTASNKRRKL